MHSRLLNHTYKSRLAKCTDLPPSTCAQGPQNHEQPGPQGFLEVVISWPDLWPVRSELLEEVLGFHKFSGSCWVRSGMKSLGLAHGNYSRKCEVYVSP